MIFQKKAAEVADKIKTEVGKAGEIVQSAIILAVTALVVSVIALVIGARRARA